MYTICLPVYNYDICGLVASLVKQALAANMPYEILVIDDASQGDFVAINKSILAYKNTRFIGLDKNIGRATIRNLLAQEAQYDYLIFMDCDAETVDNQYLERYIDLIDGAQKVVYGGRVYTEKVQFEAWYFRWLYGVQRECAPARVRELHPNRSFITFNFMVSKAVFEQVKFNETITNYGHEDTLFGYELGQKNIIIQHIDNPLVHIGLEDAPTFIAKTGQGIINLLQLYQLNLYENEWLAEVKLMRYFLIIKKIKMINLVTTFFGVTKSYLLRNLNSSKPSLLVFDLWKLGCVCSNSLKLKI